MFICFPLEQRKEKQVLVLRDREECQRELHAAALQGISRCPTPRNDFSHASVIAQSTRLLLIVSSSFSHRWADGGGFDWAEAGRDGIRLIRRCESCCVCDVIGGSMAGSMGGGGRRPVRARPFDTRVKVWRVMGRLVSTVGNSHPCRWPWSPAVWDQTSE